jgi:phosphoglycolate phosphatase-like HAD superfamily hydrolase
MVKKVIMLDVDGVLNCAEYFNTRSTPRDCKDREIDPFRVLLLHRICEETGAKVVVSSSWRLNPSSLDEVIKAVQPHYLDVTPRHARYEHRGLEIREWLDKHPEVERYAILDDERFAGQKHGNNFFRTRWYGSNGGLNRKIVEKVIRHLNST